jgi:hypothetical protein
LQIRRNHKWLKSLTPFEVASEGSPSSNTIREESVKSLSRHYWINQRTVERWKKRASVSGVASGPKGLKSTVWLLEEEPVIIALRAAGITPGQRVQDPW